MSGTCAETNAGSRYNKHKVQINLLYVFISPPFIYFQGTTTMHKTRGSKKTAGENQIGVARLQVSILNLVNILQTIQGADVFP